MSVEVDMPVIETRTRVSTDGTVTVPVGADKAGWEVVVTVSRAHPEMTQEQWADFIMKTAGSIEDPTFVRPPQGEYEVRERLE